MCVCSHRCLAQQDPGILLKSHRLSFIDVARDPTNMAAGQMLVLQPLGPLASDGHEGASAAHPGDGI